MPNRWSIVTPFKVRDARAFRADAEADYLWDEVVQKNQAGFIYCTREQQGSDRSLEQIQALVQRHLPPREFALFRIHEWTETDLGRQGLEMSDVRTRYEKVFADRIEPSTYRE